jgi:hypothetical protein
MMSLSRLRKPIGLAYQAVRGPLALVQSRLPAHSKLRAGLAAALHGADSQLGGRGSQSAGRSATPSPGSARESERQRTHDPVADAWQDEDAAREAIVEAVRERQPDVGELADPNLDVAEVQAQLQAKHALEERSIAREGDRRGRA